MLCGWVGGQELISCVVEHWLHALADDAKEATSSHVVDFSQGTCEVHMPGLGECCESV